MSWWPMDRTLEFIKDVQSSPELWNTSLEEYRHRHLKSERWTEIANKYKVTPDAARAKFKSLRTYLKQEAKKIAENRNSHWFLYKHLKFLLKDNNVIEAGTNKDDVLIEEEFSIEGNNDLYDDLDQSNDYGLQNSVEQELVPDVDCYDAALLRKRIKLEPLESEPEKSSKTSETRRIQEKALPAALPTALQAAPSVVPPRFQYTHFANHVANKLESYEPHVAFQVEFKISQILYEASMGFYSQLQNLSNTATQAVATPISLASSAVANPVSSSHQTGNAVSAPQSLENQFEVIPIDKVISQDD